MGMPYPLWVQFVPSLTSQMDVSSLTSQMDVSYPPSYLLVLALISQMDMRNGRMGTATSGGEAGDSGDINGCTFPPEHGRAWGGGNGGQYGGGGGSG